MSGLDGRTHIAVLFHTFVTVRCEVSMPLVTEWCCNSFTGFRASTFSSVVCAAYGYSEFFTFRGGSNDV